MTEEKEASYWIGMIDWSEGICWTCPFCDDSKDIFAGNICPKCGASLKVVAVK